MHVLMYVCMYACNTCTHSTADAPKANNYCGDVAYIAALLEALVRRGTLRSLPSPRGVCAAGAPPPPPLGVTISNHRPVCKLAMAERCLGREVLRPRGT